MIPDENKERDSFALASLGVFVLTLFFFSCGAYWFQENEVLLRRLGIPGEGRLILLLLAIASALAVVKWVRKWKKV